MAGPDGMFLEKVLGNFHMNSGAVAGLAVGIHGTPVPHRLERFHPGLDHFAPRLAVDGDHHANAAGGMLIGRFV